MTRGSKGLKAREEPRIMISAFTFPDITWFSAPNFETAILLKPKLIAAFNKTDKTPNRAKKPIILWMPFQGRRVNGLVGSPFSACWSDGKPDFADSCSFVGGASW